MLSKRIFNSILILLFAGLLILCGTAYIPRFISVSDPPAAGIFLFIA